MEENRTVLRSGGIRVELSTWQVAGACFIVRLRELKNSICLQVEINARQDEGYAEDTKNGQSSQRGWNWPPTCKRLLNEL